MPYLNPPRRHAVWDKTLAIARPLIPWAAYLTVALFLLRGMLPTIAESVPGTTDGWQSVWNYWWARYSLLDLHTNPFYSSYIYYPVGSSLLLHTFAPLSGLLALPLTVTVGPLLTTNLVIVASFVLCGVAAYWLARGLGIGVFGAWLAGAIYSFCNPARWQYFGAGQSGQLMMLWMPLYVLCLVKATSPQPDSQSEQIWQPTRSVPIGRQARLLSGLRWRWTLGAAITLAANGLTDWQFFVYMLIFTALYGLYLLLTKQTWRARAFALRDIGVVLGIGVLLLSPLLVATLYEAAAASYAARPIAETVAHSWDVTAFFTPNAVNPLWGGWAAQERFAGNAYGIIMGIGNGGYVPLLLGIVGVISGGRKALHWAIFGGVFALLALGPNLRVNGDVTGISMPYALLTSVPFFNISRDPGRFSIMAYLCLGLLAGFGIDALRLLAGRALRQRTTATRPIPPVLTYALGGVVAIACLGEFSAIDYPLSQRPASAFLYKLGDEQADYALLEAPLADKFYVEHAESFMAIHHKRTFGGQTARKPCHCFAMETPVVRWFWDLSLPAEDDIIPYYAPASYAPQVLRYFNVRYILLYKQMLQPDSYARAEGIVHSALPDMQPAWDDDVLTAYRLPPAPITETTDLLPISLLPDWGALERPPAGKLRWVGEKGASLVTVNTQQTLRKVRMRAQLFPFQGARTLRVSVNGTDVGSFPIKAELQTLTVDVSLQPGSNTIKLMSPEAAISPISLDPNSSDTRPLSFAVTSLSLER